MRISDWSSDVCSSDLVPHAAFLEHRQPEQELRALAHTGDDKLIDGALVRIGEVAARERVRLVEGDMLDRENLVRRQRGEIEARAVSLEGNRLGPNRETGRAAGGGRGGQARVNRV